MGEEKKIVFQLDDTRTMEISTGKMAGLANGSCLVRLGDTIIIAAACSANPAKAATFSRCRWTTRKNIQPQVNSPAVTSNVKDVLQPKRSSPAG